MVVEQMNQIYEHNFLRLIRLLPELQAPPRCLMSCEGGMAGLSVEVVEHHKYTTVIKLTQILSLTLPLATNPKMMVRVYHDAQVVEVIAYQDHQRFQPRYDYPNPDMCQRREKQRVNEFLGEWLRYCLASDWRVHASTV